MLLPLLLEANRKKKMFFLSLSPPALSSCSSI